MSGNIENLSPENINAQVQGSNTGDKDRYLEFNLGEEKFAVPLLSVKEVIAVPETTKVPFTPEYFLGIMNLRGQVLSVIDLRNRMSITEKQDEKKEGLRNQPFVFNFLL